MLHYFQRSFIFSPLIRGGRKTPFVPFFLALIFCTYNGYMQARAILKFRGSQPNIHHPYFIAGVVMFVIGMYINIQSDAILRNLRQEGSTAYQIPHGALFEYITSPNYFGELLEWFGFALAVYQLQALSFAIFAFSNMVYIEAFGFFHFVRRRYVAVLLNLFITAGSPCDSSSRVVYQNFQRKIPSQSPCNHTVRSLV